MASLNSQEDNQGAFKAGPTIQRFEIEGLFGHLTNIIEFPPASTSAEPSLLILQGPNGCGKTTMLKMLDGIIPEIDLGPFRKYPFKRAKLHFSNRDVLEITRTEDENLPLHVRFRDLDVTLSRTREGYTPEHRDSIAKFRNVAVPLLSGIRYELLDIHRSSIQQQESSADLNRLVIAKSGEVISRPRKREELNALAAMGMVKSMPNVAKIEAWIRNAPAAVLTT